MNEFFIAAIALICVAVGFNFWLGWQLLRQNGRILLRLDELEKRLDELEFGEPDNEPRSSRGDEALTSQPSTLNSQPGHQSLVTSAATTENGESRDSRFSNRSLARSRIKRDGLKAGTTAPGFRLPRLDGGELSLEELRGKRVLLVFSDPHCGPCQVLAPELEKFHRENSRNSLPPSPPPSAVLLRRTGRPSPPGEGEPPPGVVVVMISRGEPKENRTKVKEHGLTFPVVLQQRWEISRRYAMLATPMAYLIDETGIITHDVAVGEDKI